MQLHERGLDKSASLMQGLNSDETQYKRVGSKNLYFADI